jgi:hypothetical protein
LNDVGRSRKTLNYFHFTQSLSKSISSFYLHLFFVTVDNRDALLPWELMRRWKITRMCHPTVLVKLSIYVLRDVFLSNIIASKRKSSTFKMIKFQLIGFLVWQIFMPYIIIGYSIKPLFAILHKFTCSIFFFLFSIYISFPSLFLKLYLRWERERKKNNIYLQVFFCHFKALRNCVALQ